ncbi:hypothetical protein [Amycolatopsis sp. FDAARGOS 1241]|uniref:hypothetical protein n=1 Tax=Amycolatopsis sp. FDAARGOS 1241 TaxID=2778070 RepID=UPI00194EE85C|nr:hypothetical protein [Amycolatopsis sp. FDAARGOS 1241]QRP48529.1 hypothetical protein I6J71_12195 [Amycolatopsis sp. FDAARGOS 1241]
MTDGLLYVLSEPGAVGEDEFHDWYDTEHAPARVAVPGVRSGHRYGALDGATPTWLACYELDLAALASAEYAAARRRSPRERSVVDRLATLDRRVYQLTATYGEYTGPAPVIVSVALTGDEPALDEWYREEHVPLLLRVPGWHRIRRYRRVEGAGPELLAFHEISGAGLFDEPGYRHATSTPWRDRVMATVTARERRVFGHHTTVR